MLIGALTSQAAHVRWLKVVTAALGQLRLESQAAHVRWLKARMMLLGGDNDRRKRRMYAG